MRFLLIDQQTGDVINKLGSGTTLSPRFPSSGDPATPALPPFFIRFEPRHARRIGSVVFKINGSTAASVNAAPYELRDPGAGGSGPLTLPLGEVVLSAQPFSKADGKGKPRPAITRTFTVTNDPSVETEFDSMLGEAEVEAEAESEAEAGVTSGKSTGAIAIGAAAGASGANALTQTIASGSLSLRSRKPAKLTASGPDPVPAGGPTGNGAITSGVNFTPVGAPSSGPGSAGGPPASGVLTLSSAEGEAEVEVESEAEAEVGNGSAAAVGGTAVAAGASGVNAYLMADGATQPSAAETLTAVDAATSTSTSVSAVTPEFAGDTGEPGEPPGSNLETLPGLPAPPIAPPSPPPTAPPPSVLPYAQLDTESEVEVEAEAEAEAEAGIAAAAAVVSGGVGVAVVGDFAAAAALTSVATSTSTSDVATEMPKAFGGPGLTDPYPPRAPAVAARSRRQVRASGRARVSVLRPRPSSKASPPSCPTCRGSAPRLIEPVGGWRKPKRRRKRRRKSRPR